MIQRIQSLYLTLAGIISVISGIVVDFIPGGLADFVFFLIIAILAIISLFLFKKRKLQKVLNYLNIVINVLLIGFMVFALLNSSGGGFTSEKGVAFLVPVLLITLLAMANKYINKDEKLIKSVDRFR